MTCIDCNGKTRVRDSVEFEGVVFRKRICTECGKKFGTMEDIYDINSSVFKEAFRTKGGLGNRRRVND